MSDQEKPVAEKTFTGKIKDLSNEGSGVVEHPDGRIFFVPGVWPGDEGDFAITFEKKKFGHAKVIRLTTKSKDRIDPPCPHLGWEDGKCGGCGWMIADYSAQLSAKEKIVEVQLKKRGLIEDEKIIRSIAKSGETLGFRNRAQLKTDGEKIGYVSYKSKALAEINECLVLNPGCSKILSQLKEKLPHTPWKPEGKFKWSLLNINDTMKSSAEVTANSPALFQQGHTDQNDYMKDWLKEQAALLNKKEQILELFAGSGNFTKVFVENGRSDIIASEVSKEAVRSLAEKFVSVQAVAADLYKPEQWTKIKKKSDAPTTLFLDPPREGFSGLTEFLKLFPAINKIIYVSCHLPSLCNDAASLKESGWAFTHVQPVDQFPHTPHIEILSVLEKV